MKKNFVLIAVIPLFFAVCSNPTLKWIDAPAAAVSSSDSGGGGAGGGTGWLTGVNAGKLITDFYFDPSNVRIVRVNPDATGIIPIMVILPINTDISGNLSPTVFYEGQSLIPQSNVSQNFADSVNHPVPYRVYAEDGSYLDYGCKVYVRTAKSAEIVWFDLEIPGRPNNPAEGVVNQPPPSGGMGEIILRVPNGTSLTELTAKIAQTGKTITDNQGHNSSAIAAVLTGNFSSPIVYTVESEDGATTAQYKVTVIVEKSDEKAITNFSFAGYDSGQPMIGAVPQPDGKYPIVVTLPNSADADSLKSLTPNIAYTGASIAGVNVSEARTTNFNTALVVSGEPDDYTSPVSYTVSAENGSTRDYVVLVYLKGQTGGKEITGFYFSNPLAAGVIDQAANTITVTVPSGTNLSSLSPTVYHTGVSLEPASGRAVDFRSPATYTVTAQDGTGRGYTVYVLPKPATAKEITGISFPGAAVLETVIGAVPDSDGYIPISVTVSDQTKIGVLRPTITHTGVSITAPGGTPQSAKPFTDSPRSFGTPQIYRVTAEDGSFKDYEVSVHVSGTGAKIITGFVINPDSENKLTVAAVGQINQDNYTIVVKVPQTAVISGLKPAVTYLGQSLGYGESSGSSSDIDENASPSMPKTYTELTARDFSTPNTPNKYYTVTAEDKSEQEYTVTVENIPEVIIQYEGLKDERFITDTLVQNVLTIQVTGTGYGAPYGWYVDGIEQPVSATQPTLVLKITDFQPGNHQVSVSATKTIATEIKHYTNQISFWVKE
jgi:hypothetical protein